MVKNIFQFMVPAALVILLQAGLSSCSSPEGNGEGKIIAASAHPAVEGVAVERGKLVSVLNLPGELISYQQVDLYAREASFVKNILVDVGSEVEKGQLLATLEAPEISSRLAGAESRLKSSEALYLASKAGYERLVATSKTPGTISPNDLDQARAKMNSDLAQLESSRAGVKEITNTLSYLSIHAPFQGVITARNVNPGAYVGSSGRGTGDPLFVLQEQKHLRLVVAIPEAYSVFLKPGHEVEFSIKALPQKTFKAKIKRMAGALDLKLRSQRVEMDVTNEEGKLLPGMIASLTIPLEGDSTWIVPNTAVVNSQENVFIIKIVDDTARWMNITPGRTAQGKTEIFGPLRAGDVLLKKASDEVRNGQYLRVAE